MQYVKWRWVCLLVLGILPITAMGQESRRGSEKLFRHKTIERAWEAAVTAKRPLLVMFTSDQCVYCQKMLTQTYGHPVIQQLLVGRTESVLAHANDYEALVKKMGLRGFPTSLLISPKGEVLGVLEGFVEPRDFMQQVKPLLDKKAS